MINVENSYWYPKGNGKKLTLNDVIFICDNYKKISNKKLAKIFKVDLSIIIKVLKKNNLFVGPKRYTYDEVLIEALKYCTAKDFNEANYNMYTVAYRRGIIKRLFLENKYSRLGSLYSKYVYIYFLKNSTIYVGQTCNLKRRHSEHLKSWLKEEEMIKKMVSNLLEVNRATRLEEALRQRYTKLGYNVLNKTSCHSTGGGCLKWTKEVCYNKAQEYNSKKEWEIHSIGSYQAAGKNGWIDYCSKNFKKSQNKPVKNTKTGQIFKSASEASLSLGKNYGDVTRSIIRKTKCAGQTFVYLTPEEILEWKAKQNAS